MVALAATTALQHVTSEHGYTTWQHPTLTAIGNPASDLTDTEIEPRNFYCRCE